MSMSVAIARVWWMMLGPVALVLLAFGIVQTGNGWLTLVDLLYAAALIGIIAARLFEFHAGNPLTTTGEPANLTDLQVYLLGLGTVGVLVWIVANLAGNHWLAG